MDVSLTKVKVKRYLKSIKDFKKNVVTPKMVSQDVGIIEDVVRNELAYFDPMIRLFAEYNLIDIIPFLENYITPVDKPKPTVKKGRSRIVLYSSVGDFVYKNMTNAGGIIDPNVRLKLSQLKDLRKVVNNQISTYKETEGKK